MAPHSATYTDSATGKRKEEGYDGKVLELGTRLRGRRGSITPEIIMST